MITSFKLPTTIVSNGVGVNAWQNESNILLVDDKFASTSGATAELTVGTFNLNLPVDATVSNFVVRVKGYRGSFDTTLQIYAVDTTTGITMSYPMAPFQGFDGTNTLYTLPSTLFSTAWDYNQANNIQLKLIADGELHLDSIELNCTYVPAVVPVPPSPSSGQVVVDEFVQGQRFQLAQSMTASDLFLFAKSFTLPNGVPIQYSDFHGEALITIDQGVPGLEENVRITNVEHDYDGTGLVKLSFTTITNRGLNYVYPYTGDLTRCYPHNGTAEFVISNSAPFYSRFLRMNQIDALVSAPIYVEDEGTPLTDPVHTLDFEGPGVSVVNDGIDPFKKIVTITGGAGVQSVTSSDTFIDVDNSDAQNPVLSLDTVALANDPTFLGDVITNINTSGDVSVITDGVTITGDGTSGNPLTATGGSDNYTVKATTADTAPSFLDSKIELVSGTNTTVTKTILNPGSNEKIRYQVNSTGGSGNNSLTIPGNEYYIGNDEPGFIVSFDKYIITFNSQLEAYYIDNNKSYNRATIPASTPPVGWNTPTTFAPTVSEDGQFLYITKVYTVSFGVFGLTVDKLDVNMNIVSTYTSTPYSPTIVSVQPMTFVKGNNIIICANATQPYSVGNPIYAEEFLMSGSTLTQTGITNIQYGISGGGFFNFPRNGFTAIDGFTYLQYEFSGAEQVFKNTYSSLTLTNIGTSVFNTNNTGIETVYSWYTGSKTYFGFIIDGTNIGWFRLVYSIDKLTSPPYTQYFVYKYLYQKYPF